MVNDGMMMVMMMNESLMDLLIDEWIVCLVKCLFMNV